MELSLRVAAVFFIYGWLLPAFLVLITGGIFGSLFSSFDVSISSFLPASYLDATWLRGNACGAQVPMFSLWLMNFGPLFYSAISAFLSIIFFLSPVFRTKGAAAVAVAARDFSKFSFLNNPAGVSIVVTGFGALILYNFGFSSFTDFDLFDGKFLCVAPLLLIVVQTLVLGLGAFLFIFGVSYSLMSLYVWIEGKV
ncbi:hypothetical protein [Thioclava sp.]|uniref:hypothetical protein n=1 Tax=Thioclava sp. TaxID=1933450 RepID=UPI0032422C9E